MVGRYRGNGEGTISKRKDGRWVGRYYTLTTGGPKRKAIYAGPRSEVSTLLAPAIAKRDGKSPTTVEPSKLALSEYLAERLAAKRPEVLSSDTQRHYKRHTAATLVLKKRVSANVVAQVLGHYDPAMTLRRYALPDIQEIVAEAMEGYAF